MTTALAAAAAPGILRSRARARYPLAFSTLGCPGWSWQTILQQADTLGYAALELRGVAGEMDLTKVPELTGTPLGRHAQGPGRHRRHHLGPGRFGRDAPDGSGAARRRSTRAGASSTWRTPWA